MTQYRSVLEGLNPEQERAVKSVKGKLLILAGAGSGKTRVLMSRIAYLIATAHAKPSEVLGLTFTNKAAEEMRERLFGMIGPSAKAVTLCTFHSFCLYLLREHAFRLGFTPRFTLYHEHDIRRLVGQIARDEIECRILPSIAPTLERISKARQLGIEPKDLPATEELWHDQFCQTVYERLKTTFRAYNAMDFDGLIEHGVQLLETFPDVREKISRRYGFVMIDEYQDTNPMQDRLAKLLAYHNNLCVVGDDDQSIYGWRGAQVRNILDFDADLIIKLEQNYRSSNTILQAANHAIAANEQRFKKTLWSQKGEGRLLEVFHAPGERQEASAVVKRMVALKKREGLQWRDFAILYRSNALARSFETALLQTSWSEGPDGPWHRSIPYEVYGGDSFYDSREVRDIISYLRAIVNPKDQGALLSIINQPRRGIGEVTVDTMTQKERALGGHLIDYIQEMAEQESTHKSAREGLKELLTILKEAREQFSSRPLAEALKWLISFIKYEKAIEEEVKSNAMRALKRKNLEGLILSAAEFEKEWEQKKALGEPQSALDRAAEFASSSQLDNSLGNHGKKRHQNAVSLMTFHSAKGLEFPAVFLVGLEDHILPHERSLDTTGIEEERRLFYVALTRAQKNLCLSMATVRERYGKPSASKPSRFLFDIPSSLMNITACDSVLS